MGKKIATIYVGDDVEPFPVHSDLITATSDFFSKTLNRAFKERDGEVRLPDHKSEHFACYVQWLYEGHFETTRETGWTNLTELHVLGNYLQDRHFRNTVTDALSTK